MDARWYVYELSDPSNGDVFYVGKGTGDRMYQHGKSDISNKQKTNKIKEIGYDKVVRTKVAEFWCEKAAYKHEEERIKSYKSLTNIAKVAYNCRTRYISFFRLIKEVMSYGVKTENSFTKLKQYFPRNNLPSNEYVMLYDMAEKINKLVCSDDERAKKRVRVLRGIIPI